MPHALPQPPNLAHFDAVLVAVLSKFYFFFLLKFVVIGPKRRDRDNARKDNAK